MSKRPQSSAQRPLKGRDYRLETCFVGGKMKHRRIPLIEGQPVAEFLRHNTDDSFLAAESHFEILHERECERNHPDSESLFKDNDMIPL